MTPASPPAVKESAGTRAQGASLPFRHRLSAARLCVLLLRYRLPETLAVRGSLFTGAGAGGETTSESSLLLPKWLEHTGLLWRWCSVRGRCGCAWMEEPAVVLCLLCLCCLPAVSRHVLTINTRCCFALVPTWLYFCSVSPCIRQASPCARVALQPRRGSCKAWPRVLCMGEGTQLLLLWLGRARHRWGVPPARELPPRHWHEVVSSLLAAELLEAWCQQHRDAPASRGP